MTEEARGSRVVQPSRWLFHLFGLYVRWYLPRHFHGLRVASAFRFPRSASGALVFYLNHPSWWDPLTCLMLAAEFLPAMEHYAPMDAAALRRYRFFRKLGLFPVDAGTGRGGLQFLRAGREVLATEGAVLWLTPQGGFVDVRARPVVFKDGLAALLAHSPGAVTVVPLALEYCFWDERLPEILVNVGDGICIQGGGEMKELTSRLAAALTLAQEELAALAMTRDRANFETLLEGRAGVGMMYDFWSRLRAAWRGRRYEAEHGSLRRG